MIIEGYRELANFRKYVNKNDLESFFNYMDLDSDGKISNDELKNGLDNFGIFLSS